MAPLVKHWIKAALIIYLCVSGGAALSLYHFLHTFFHDIQRTVCQPIKQENVEIPVPHFFQHALQEKEWKKNPAELGVGSSNKGNHV